MSTSTLLLKVKTRPASKSIIAGLLFLGLVALAYSFMPVGIDWEGSFRNAALLILSGRSPYEAYWFASPPWTPIILLPLAVLPLRLSNALLFAVSLSAFLYISHRLKGRILSAVLLLLSLSTIYSLYNGQIDFLIPLGLVLPPRLGLFFVLTKPQAGAAIAVYWLVEAYREGSWKKVITTFMPVALAAVLSFLIYGFWPAQGFKLIHSPWNASMWPYGLPAGILLLLVGIHKRNIRYALLSSPFFSPFVNFGSWSAAMLALAPNAALTAAASLLSWLVFIIKVSR